MKSNYVMLGLIVLVWTATPPPSAAQEAGQQMAGMADASQTAVADCARAQAQLLQTIDAANTRVEAARQSNSPAAMRAAMDDIQGALGSLRAQLAACRDLAKTPAADPHAGHVMPTMPQAPGTPVMQPGSTTTAAAAPGTKTPAVDPHAGHTMTPAPTAKPPASTAKPPATTKPTTKPTTDPHAGHTMTTAPTPKQPPTTTKPPATPKPAVDPHAGHKMPPSDKPKTPATEKPKSTTPPVPIDHSKMPMGGAAPKKDEPAAMKENPKLPVMPAERVADPACADNVKDPKAPTAVYQRKVYYFCSTKDRDEFRKDPAAYLKKRPR